MESELKEAKTRDQERKEQQDEPKYRTGGRF
jgi:hypothetical protein